VCVTCTDGSTGCSSPVCSDIGQCQFPTPVCH
jgi:hypothetical protein